MTEVRAKKSTIVRSDVSLKQRVTRTAFGLLERRAPSVGARWAERLWCTVQHADRSRSEPAVPGTLVNVAMRDSWDAGGREDAGTAFVAEVWGTEDAVAYENPVACENPVVYLIHGWGGHRAQFGAFVAPLLAAGFRVVALDAPSHGDSGPGAFGVGRSLITEFTGALAACVRAFGPAHAVIGHSLGGGAAALAVLDGLPTRRLVLISPMPDPNQFLRGFAAMLGFGERISDGLARRLERRTGLAMAHFDAVRRAAAVEAQLPPLLVIHDQQDRQIPFSQGKAIAAAWQGAELLGTRGLGHNRILRDPEVVRTAVDFVKTRVTADVHTAGRPT